MFSRAATTLFYASVAFGLLAAATPNPGEKRWGTPTKTVTVTAPGSTATESAGDCKTGPIQCCDTIRNASDPAAAALLGLLGIHVIDLDALVGLTCSPITVIGVGSGSNCNASPVCCDDNSYGGVISIGCVPVSL